MVDVPKTRYARVGDAAVAYQVVGDGPVDLLVPLGNSSHLELLWEIPAPASFLRRLSEFCRVLPFDRRSSGLSDPLPTLGAGALEDWVTDCLAVLDAVDSEHAAVFGHDIGGPMSLLMAASHPDRVSALVLVDAYARWTRTPDYPGVPERLVQAALDDIWDSWGSGRSILMANPRLEGDAEAERMWARWERYSMAPGTRHKTMEAWFGMDVRDAVPLVRCPVLIVQGLGNPYIRPEHGRWLAEHLGDVRYVEMEGDGYLDVYYRYPDAVVEDMREFLTGERRGLEPNRVLATVLFTDIVDSTSRAAAIGDRAWSDLLDRHDQIAASEVQRGGGRLVKSTGDGVLATFDGPARAVRAGVSLLRRWRSIDIDARVGLHTGEVELRGEDVGGLAVHIASRVQALAGPGEVLVSRTVRDLVAGSGLPFVDRGTHELKGVPDSWQLLAVDQEQL